MLKLTAPDIQIKPPPKSKQIPFPQCKTIEIVRNEILCDGELIARWDSEYKLWITPDSRFFHTLKIEES